MARQPFLGEAARYDARHAADGEGHIDGVHGFDELRTGAFQLDAGGAFGAQHGVAHGVRSGRGSGVEPGDFLPRLDHRLGAFLAFLIAPGVAVLQEGADLFALVRAGCGDDHIRADAHWRGGEGLVMAVVLAGLCGQGGIKARLFLARYEGGGDGRQAGAETARGLVRFAARGRDGEDGQQEHDEQALRVAGKWHVQAP